MKVIITFVTLFLIQSNALAVRHFMPMVDDEELKETRVDYFIALPDSNDSKQTTENSAKNAEEQGISSSETIQITTPISPRVSPISPAQGVSIQITPR
jgi:hypothetical protein